LGGSDGVAVEGGNKLEDVTALSFYKIEMGGMKAGGKQNRRSV
jgi:hypothetical protein